MLENGALVRFVAPVFELGKTQPETKKNTVQIGAEKPLTGGRVRLFEVKKWTN